MSDDKSAGSLAAAWAETEMELFPGDSGSRDERQSYQRMFYVGAAACCEVLMLPVAADQISAEAIAMRALLLHAELSRFRDELKAGLA